jgi:hypothetical protein
MAFSTFDSDDTAGSSPGCLSAGRSLPAVRALSLSEFFRVATALNSDVALAKACSKAHILSRSAASNREPLFLSKSTEIEISSSSTQTTAYACPMVTLRN